MLLPTMRMSETVSFVAESDGPDVSRSSFFVPNIVLGIDGIPLPGLPCASNNAGMLAKMATTNATAIEMRRLSARWDKCEFPNELRTVRRGMTLRRSCRDGCGTSSRCDACDLYGAGRNK